MILLRPQRNALPKLPGLQLYASLMNSLVQRVDHCDRTNTTDGVLKIGATGVNREFADFRSQRHLDATVLMLRHSNGWFMASNASGHHSQGQRP